MGHECLFGTFAARLEEALLSGSTTSWDIVGRSRDVLLGSFQLDQRLAQVGEVVVIPLGSPPRRFGVRNRLDLRGRRVGRPLFNACGRYFVRIAGVIGRGS